MWRRRASPGSARNPPNSLRSSSTNRVPDRNLSDDDEELDEITYGDDSLESLRSLYSQHSKKKQEISLSGNENGARELKNESWDHPKSLLRKELDHVSGDESISDEEYGVPSNLLCTSGIAKAKRNNDQTVESKSQEVACLWSAVSEEANKLVCLNEKTSSSSFRGGRGKAKLKFSIHPYTHIDGQSSSSHDVKVENEILPLEGIKGYSGNINLVHETNENSMTELLDDLQEENDQLPEKFVPHKPIVAPSMAELLEDLQENNNHFLGTSNLFLQNGRPKEMKNLITGKKATYTLGPRILDDEDPPEFVDDSMPSDDDDNHNNDIRLRIHGVKGQTMADLFQEAFSTAILDEPIVRSCKQVGGEFHQRLQQVIQTEKERNMEFSKQMQSGWSPCYESKFLDVQILTRVLEAKLTVCWCLVGENIESSQRFKALESAGDDGALKKTIIFNSKICDNVDLEVGNRVRVHSPWKEIQVNEGEKIILCMYFSQIMS